MTLSSSRRFFFAAAATLLGLEVLCFAPHFFKTGFYLDDWVFLDRALGSGKAGLMAGIRAFSAHNLASRPLEIPQFALLTFAGGMDPWRYRLMNLLAEMVLGLSLFATLKGLSANGTLALLAAALAMTFPNHGGTHIWMSQSPQTWAMAFCFAGFAVHAGGRVPGAPCVAGPARVALAQAGYLASLSLYESTFFMPFALAAGLWAASPSFPGLARDERRALAKAMLPYALSAAAFVAYQRWIAPIWLEPSPKVIGFSLRHFTDVYLAAMSCATVWVVRMFKLAGWRIAGPLWWLILPLASLAAGGFLSREDPKTPAAGKGGRVLMAFGAAAFFCSYLPYVVTRGYVPRMYGVMNRVNMGGGIAAGAVLAALLESAFPAPRRPRCRLLATAGLLAAFAVCHWMTGSQWAAAWEVQKGILRDIGAQLPAGPATIILRDTKPHMRGAPVFWSHYDISRAIWLTTGRRDITANWSKSGTIDAAGVTVVNGNNNVFHYPFVRLYFFEGLSRRLVPVSGPALTPGGASSRPSP